MNATTKGYAAVIEANLNWAAGVTDVFGSIRLNTACKGPHMFIEYKTPYPDRLHELQRALGLSGKLTGPEAPTGIGQKQNWILTYRGAACAIIENMLTPRMRTLKREEFFRKREELQEIRAQRGIRGHCIISDEPEPLQSSDGVS